MSASSPLFDGPGLQALFADLDAELRTIDKMPVIELAVVGGAAMALQWNLRSTRDVDFVSEGVPQDLRDAAGRVAERHDLPADWLNDGAKGFTPDLAYDGTVVYRGETLTVSVPAGRYLLAMKLFSARETDLDDAVFLGHQYGVTTADKLLELVTEAYRTRPLDVRVQYFAAEVATRVDGLTNQPRLTLRPQPPRDELGR